MALATGLSACGSAADLEDAGARDGSVPDAWVIARDGGPDLDATGDGGSGDADVPDAVALDGGAPDASAAVPDAAVPDAAVPDAMFPDAGVPDAAVPDAGVCAGQQDGTSCSDGDACNGEETCQAGVCSAGLSPACDDGNSCTDDTCDALLGCQHTAVDEGMTCASGLACRDAETCQAGVCTPGAAATCFTVGGTVSGLAGAGLVLASGDEQLAIASDGTFAFDGARDNGEPYTVTITSQPSTPPQRCHVERWKGAIAGADVRDVLVTCSACGDGVRGADPVLAIELEWMTTAVTSPDQDITFTINGTVIHSESGNNGAPACNPPTRRERITDPAVLALITGAAGGDQFGVSYAEYISYARVWVHQASRRTEVDVFDFSLPICPGLYTGASRTVTQNIDLTEECDDGNLVGGDGCSASCRDEGCEAGVDSDGDRLTDCAELATHGTDPTAADTDGDGLSDGDEALGTAAGLDLPALGADPLRKDVFVEIDWTSDGLDACGAHDHRPPQEALDLVVAMFAAAPVANPDGSTGISVHFDIGQGGAFSGGNLLGAADVLSGDPDVDLQTYKTTHFAAAREGSFHYAIATHALDTGAGGVAEIQGDDLMIAQGSCDVCGTCSVQYGWVLAETIAHELGHNLGLTHAGYGYCNYKPNYPSIMNYRHVFDGIDVDCDDVPDAVMDFSRGDRIALDETDLDERRGVCGGDAPIDWDGSGTITAGVSRDLNPHADQVSGCGGTLTAMQDYDDWSNISFRAMEVGDADTPVATEALATAHCYDDPRSARLRTDANHGLMAPAPAPAPRSDGESDAPDATGAGCSSGRGASGPLAVLLALGYASHRRRRRV